MKIGLKDIGTLQYEEAWKLQRELFDKVALVQDDLVGELVLVEHPHVYTLGKNGHENNLLVNADFLNKIGATFVKVDRGGDITYHGYGQLVGYPILNLVQMNISLRDYIFRLEEAIIDTVAQFGVAAGRSDGATGVWVDGARKIAAIGVKASRGVTMHGFALNVSTDLSYFSHINPCGFVDKGVTSIEKERGLTIGLDEVKRVFEKKFEKQFGVELQID